MAALNIQETEQLRHAKAVLDRILREGFDANSVNPQAQRQRREIIQARDEVKTVVTMKGYYPS